MLGDHDESVRLAACRAMSERRMRMAISSATDGRADGQFRFRAHRSRDALGSAKIRADAVKALTLHW